MPSMASVAPSGHSSPCSATSSLRPRSQADSESTRRPSRSKMTARIKRGTRESNPNLGFWRPASSPLDQSPRNRPRDCSRSVRRTCEHVFVWRPRDIWSYSYLLGLYLGDGCVSCTGRSYQLRVVLDGIYPDIFDECAAAVLATVEPRAVYKRPARNSRAVIVEASSKLLPEIFPQYGAGPKHERPIVLADWQRAAV